MKEQKYIIEDVKSFEPKHIFECGQCFRWNLEEDGSYTGIVGKNVLNVMLILIQTLMIVHYVKHLYQVKKKEMMFFQLLLLNIKIII